MGYPVEAAVQRAGLGENYPRITEYVRRFQARPAYKAAMEKNGDFKSLS
ncbi:MAG: hypothetical protein QNK37_06715 [Acidobacteriota bacterium]|nr:hypothetical protein [Acidobacteriota bacterium]